MSDSFTPLNLVKPAPGGSVDTWGQKVNANTDIIDTQIRNASAAGAAANVNANGRVLRTGDTMTGNLTVQKSNPVLLLQKASSTGEVNRIQGNTGLNGRWMVDLGGAENETGSNAGSPFRVGRFSDAGAYIGDALTIDRATGNVTVFARIAIGADGSASNELVSKGYVDAQATNAVNVANAANANANNRVARSGDTMTGDLTLARAGSPGTGALFLGNSGQRFLFWDGSNYSMPGGTLHTTNLATGFLTVSQQNQVNSVGTIYTQNSNIITDNGSVFGVNFILNDDGFTRDTGMYHGGGGVISFNTNGVTRLQLRPSDSQFWGNVFCTGDYIHNSDRKLKDHVTTARGLEVVNKLRGVEFSWKRNGQRSAGVIAQELEAILPHLISTDTDGNQSVAYLPLIGHLIEAINELSARVEELEGEFI